MYKLQFQISVSHLRLGTSIKIISIVGVHVCIRVCMCRCACVCILYVFTPYPENMGKLVAVLHVRKEMLIERSDLHFFFYSDLNKT